MSDSWEKIALKPSPYDTHATYAYKDGNIIRKLILVSEVELGYGKSVYVECQMNETLSDDGTMLLPKTSKGKPKKLTATTLSERPSYGMVLSYGHCGISLYNQDSQHNYYQSTYDDFEAATLKDFIAWVEAWCNETTDEDLEDIRDFANKKRQHFKYKEGDYFRARIDRRTYVYGKILFSYDRLRKEKKEFWNVFWGKPLVVGIYRMTTGRNDLTIDELSGIPMLPSHVIMDNVFYYGEFKIIGNGEVTSDEIDLPIHYGRGLSPVKELIYQCGETYICIKDAEPLYDGFSNTGCGWTLHIDHPILEKCIRENSNMPFWEESDYSEGDLRNPKYKKELKKIKKQLKRYL